MNSIFSKLTKDELTAVAVPIQNVLSTLASGDGSTAAIVGQGVVLQGLLLSLTPQIQKIGVNDLASLANAWLSEQLAKVDATSFAEKTSA